MTDPPNWKRIGETANKILDELEKIHGAENVESTDKHDSGNGSSGSNPVREPDAVARSGSDPA